MNGGKREGKKKIICYVFPDDCFLLNSVVLSLLISHILCPSLYSMNLYEGYSAQVSPMSQSPIFGIC